MATLQRVEAAAVGLRRCMRRGQPYGEEAWLRRTAVTLGLESSLCPVKRPRKVQKAG